MRPTASAKVGCSDCTVWLGESHHCGSMQPWIDGVPGAAEGQVWGDSTMAFCHCRDKICGYCQHR